MKRIVVTGSNGFIGRALCRTLRNKGIAVIGVDLFPNKDDAMSITRDMLTAIDGVIHLGAMSRALWGEMFPDRCFELNCESVKDILKLIEIANPNCWFLLASSKEVYGDAVSLPITEDHELLPKGVYAKSKLYAERQVQAAGKLGLRCGIVRLSTVYGGSSDHVGRLIPSCVMAVLTGQPLSIDSESTVVDPTHIDDVVRGLIAFAEFLSASGSQNFCRINLCSGQGVTIREIASIVSKCAQREIQTKPGVSRVFMSKQFIGCNAKAKEFLNWSPQISFREGINQYLEMLLKTRDQSEMFRRSSFIDELVKAGGINNAY